MKMSSKVKLVILQLVITGFLFGIDCLILRLPCQTEAYFTVNLLQKFLPNAVLRNIGQITSSDCAVECVKNPKCKSINFQMDTSDCQLNSKHHEMLGVSLETKPNWIYISTNYSALKIGLTCRSASFCPSGILCRDICEPPYYRCVVCDEFHEGLHCDIRKDFDECLYSPCKNNATCTDLTRDYSCTCKSGYTGKNCDQEINECLSYPCKNGGDCTDLFNGYSCSCVPGFTGKNCETNVNECQSSPCQNEGTCNDGIRKYDCTCAAGYKGTNCDIDVDECASEPCKNGGTCVNNVNSYSCKCRSDYTGTNCQSEDK